MGTRRKTKLMIYDEVKDREFEIGDIIDGDILETKVNIFYLVKARSDSPKKFNILLLVNCTKYKNAEKKNNIINYCIDKWRQRDKSKQGSFEQLLTHINNMS